MKKIYLSMLLLIGFQIVVNAQLQQQSCKPVAVTVNSIAELNTQIDLMEANSATTSTTITIADGIYNSSINSSLNRDIDVEGGCPCTIKGENNSLNGYDVYLKGDVSWRLNNSNNLTIDGIIFRRTVNVGDNIPLIFLDTDSYSNVIKNSILMEFAPTRSLTPSLTPPFTDSYPFLRIKSENLPEVSNIIDNCIFQNKYSKGNYVELINSKNVKITSSTFRESDTTLFTSLTLDEEGKPDVSEVKRYIFSKNSEHLLIKESSFSNKYSYWAYVQLNEGTNNTIENNTFYESTDPDDPNEPLNSTITNSQYKDYIKVVDEVNPTITLNDFIRKFSLSNMVNYAPTKNEDDYMTTIFGGTISNNNFGPKYQTEPSSMIKIGSCYRNDDNDVARTNVVVSNNTFEGYSYNGHPYSEIISNKSSGNKYYNNEFINCYGSLRIRCGDDVTIKGNKFIGNGTNINGFFNNTNTVSYQRGIAISGKRHEIYNNHFQNLTFSVLDIYGGSFDESLETSYIRVENVDFAFNTIVNCALNISFRKELASSDGPGHVNMATYCKIDNNIFYNVNSLGTHILVNIDSDYGGSTHAVDIDALHKNSFKNNIFYNNASHPHLITPNNTDPHDPLYDWSLPNGSVTYTINPELSFDAVDKIYKLTAGSNAINASYVDSMDPNHYSYVTDDILDNTRDANRDIGCHEYTAASRNATNSIGLIENTNTKLQGYPNPVSDMITLTGTSDESLYVIYNINGVKVQEGILSNNRQIKVEKLSKGMYFLTINNAETIKLIKN